MLGERTYGACLLDGLTLQNAADLISSRGWLPLDTRAYLFPIRLAALAQVVTALVCQEQIVTVRGQHGGWTQDRDLAAALSRGVIAFADVPGNVTRRLEIFSGEKILGLLASHAFQQYVEELIAKSAEGSVLAIARDYHKLSAAVFTTPDVLKSIDSLCAQAETISWSGEMRTAVPRAAALFATGAFFYREHALHLGIPYSPFALRAPFCVYEDALAGRPPISGVRTAMEIILGEARQSMASVPGSGTTEWVDLQLPPVLALVLKRASQSSDIFRTALEIRDNDEARAFRRDVQALTKHIQTGDVPGAKHAAETIRDRARTAFQSGEIPETKISISVGGIGVQTPLKKLDFLRRWIHAARRRTTFYQLLASEMPALWRLRRDVERLFDADLEETICRDFARLDPA